MGVIGIGHVVGRSYPLPAGTRLRQREFLSDARVVTAFRYGYFSYTFITGWLFRGADREERPVLFWFLFVLQLIRVVLFLGVSTLLVWVIAATLIERTAH